MSLTAKELLTALHGLVLGAGFLLAFAGGWSGLWSFREKWLTPDGRRASARRMIGGTWTMAALAWATVGIGTYVLYPWYRAQPPANLTGQFLSAYPRSYLLGNGRTANWHRFGMEWKEHIAWLAPVLATAVAFAVTRQRRSLHRDDRLRRILLLLFAVAFGCAAIAGLFGALINKAAAIR